MREIKFRGKRVDNGEWVYGWIYGDKVKAIITLIKNNQMNEVETFDTSRVIPETVSQYTGLKDKNGVEIYEGDILHKDSYWGWYAEFEDGAFCKIPTNEVQRINWVHYRMKQNDVEDWEIIGNIYDNPELMEE